MSDDDDDAEEEHESGGGEGESDNADVNLKTYQVPCSQGQKSTLVLHLLKKRPEAISYCNCNWRRYVFRRLELFLPKKNAVEY